MTVKKNTKTDDTYYELDSEVTGWSIRITAPEEPVGSGESIELPLRFRGRSILETFSETVSTGLQGGIDFLELAAGKDISEKIGKFYSNEQTQLLDIYLEAFSSRNMRLPSDHEDPKAP